MVRLLTMVSNASVRTETTRAERPRRRLPAAQRRALILGAALRTFAAHGYDGASMDEIAAGAGISKAVVYDHVASKRDLYTQLLHAIRDEIEHAVETALGEPGEGGEQRVRAAVEAIYRYVEEHQEASRLLVLELQGANVSDVGRELEERVSGHLAQTLGNEPGLFGGAEDRARQLTILAELLKSAVLGLTGWWYRHPDAPREDLVDRTVDVVWPALERALGGVAPGV
jgi:AcrR family transcriptional regulator